MSTAIVYLPLDSQLQVSASICNSCPPLSCLFIYITCLVCRRQSDDRDAFFGVPVACPFSELQLHAGHANCNCKSATRLTTTSVGARLQFLSIPKCIFHWGYSLFLCAAATGVTFFGMPVACPFPCNCMRAMLTAIACLSLDSQLQVSALDCNSCPSTSCIFIWVIACLVCRRCQSDD